ncbi:MAG: hypothetical protein WCK09_15295 [Bacteroidota bacterium]
MADVGLSQIISAITNVAKIGINVISENSQGTKSGFFSNGMDLTNGQPAIIEKTNETQTVFSPTVIIVSMIGITALAIGLMFIAKKNK